MHAFRTDSQFFREALERVGKADDARASRLPIPAGGGRKGEQNGGGKAFVLDRRESEAPRVIGRLHRKSRLVGTTAGGPKARRTPRA